MGISGKYFVSLLMAMFLCAISPCHAAAALMAGSMDADKTVAVVTSTNDGGSTEMAIFTKKGDSYVLDDIDSSSTWHSFALASSDQWWQRCTISVSSATATTDCSDNSGAQSNGSTAISYDTTSGVMTIPTGATTRWDCHLDSGKTVAGCTETGDTASKLVIMTRKGSYATADFQGNWYFNLLTSPGPFWVRGAFSVDSSGHYTMTGDTLSGDPAGDAGSSATDTAEGMVTFTSSGNGPITTILCHLDAGKTVMGCTLTMTDSTTALAIMTKEADLYSSADLTGIWYVHSMTTGATNPMWENGIFSFGTGGGYTVSGTEYTAGSATSWNDSGTASFTTATTLSVQPGISGCAWNVYNAGIFYPLIKSGCDNANASDQTVRLRGTSLSENAVLQNSSPITLQGGYDCTFSSPSGWTTLAGALIFNGAAVIIDKITISGDANGNVYDVDANGIPKFAVADYIELGKIYRISKFRSGEGHDYSDDFEKCRSMKHYFNPKVDVDWSTVKIFSPIKGTVSAISQESYPNSGMQVHIRSFDYPAFTFILFHVNVSAELHVGATVAAGDQLGTHIGSVTTSDIAVSVNTPNGWKLVSYFDVMTDSLFQEYITRGISTRSDAIISKEARDADPLTCNGETFTNGGNLDNWVNLN